MANDWIDQDDMMRWTLAAQGSHGIQNELPLLFECAINLGTMEDSWTTAGHFNGVLTPSSTIIL